MIATQESKVRQDIFQSIRYSVQELHEDKVMVEDAHSAPFLFKSADARIWARIFYRSMRDFSAQEMQREIKKLWMLMPNDAMLYLFYPELDRDQIIKMNSADERLSFFEYAGLGGERRTNLSVHICKWEPSSFEFFSNKKSSSQNLTNSETFFLGSRLTPQEISGLAELALTLNRL